MIYSLACFDETDDYEYSLRKDTSLYYKIQLHMFLTDTRYCDFVIWTTCDYLDIRIKRDDVKVNTSKSFFLRKIMPDLMRSGCWICCFFFLFSFSLTNAFCYMNGNVCFPLIAFIEINLIIKKIQMNFGYADILIVEKVLNCRPLSTAIMSGWRLS